MSFDVSSWLSEIGQYLHNNTVGVYGNTPTANIFLQQLPNSPVLAIGIFATGGIGLTNDDPIKRLNLQVLIRRQYNLEGLRYANTVFDLLDGQWNITPSFNGRILADHEPGPNYLSANNYPVYTLNFHAVLGRKD